MRSAPVNPLNPSRTDRTSETVRSLRASGYNRLRPKFDLPVYEFLSALDGELTAELVACLIERGVEKDLHARRTSFAVERFPDHESSQTILRRAITNGRDGDIGEALREGWAHLPDWWTHHRKPDSGWGHATKHVYHRAKDHLEARMADECRQQRQMRQGRADAAVRGRIDDVRDNGELDFAMPGRDPGDVVEKEMDRQFLREMSKRLAAMVDDLPQPQRDVKHLQRQGHSEAETAKQLNLTEVEVTYLRRSGTEMLKALKQDYTEKVCRIRPDLNLWVGRHEWRPQAISRTVT